MTLPDERSRPADNETAPEYHRAGDTQHSRPDLASVADDAWRVLTGHLLSSPPVSFAREVLDQLPPKAPNPLLCWWFAGIRLCVEAGVSPNPLSAAVAAVNAGLDTPPALRGLVTDAGWGLVGSTTAIPFASTGIFVEIVREAEVHRAAEKALAAMAAVIWRGDTAALAEVWQREAGAILALVAEMTR